MKRHLINLGYILAGIAAVVLMIFIYQTTSNMLDSELSRQYQAETQTAATQTQQATGGVNVSLEDASPVVPAGILVTVDADQVNIRDTNKNSTGDYATRGQVFTVYWRDDGFAEIITPVEHKGNLIWRGCTSDTGGYGCSAADD